MVKHTQRICWKKPANCLSVFDHFVGLAVKVLNYLLMHLDSYSSTVNCQRKWFLAHLYWYTYIYIFSIIQSITKLSKKQEKLFIYRSFIITFYMRMIFTRNTDILTQIQQQSAHLNYFLNFGILNTWFVELLFFNIFIVYFTL